MTKYENWPFNPDRIKLGRSRVMCPECTPPHPVRLAADGWGYCRITGTTFPGDVAIPVVDGSARR